MKILSIVLIAMLLLSAMLVFADTAAAGSKVRVEGQITDTNSNGVSGLDVEIERYYKKYDWVSLGTNTTNATGGYNIPNSSGYKKVYPRAGKYQLKIDGTVVEIKELTNDDDNWSKKKVDGKIRWVYVWDYSKNHRIPEFPTIALPVVALLGLAFILSRRKQKK